MTHCGFYFLSGSFRGLGVTFVVTMFKCISIIFTDDIFFDSTLYTSDCQEKRKEKKKHLNDTVNLHFA